MSLQWHCSLHSATHCPQLPAYTGAALLPNLPTRREHLLTAHLARPHYSGTAAAVCIVCAASAVLMWINCPNFSMAVCFSGSFPVHPPAPIVCHLLALWSHRYRPQPLLLNSWRNRREWLHKFAVNTFIVSTAVKPMEIRTLVMTCWNRWSIL